MYTQTKADLRILGACACKYRNNKTLLTPNVNRTASQDRCAVNNLTTLIKHKLKPLVFYFAIPEL